MGVFASAYRGTFDDDFAIDINPKFLALADDNERVIHIEDATEDFMADAPPHPEVA